MSDSNVTVVPVPVPLLWDTFAEADVKGTLYLAGPMRGIKNFNVDTFDAAADSLRAQHWMVLNPCDKDRAEHGDGVMLSETGDLADIAHLDFDLTTTLLWDLEYIAKHANGIALLPGWKNSSGATAEHALAKALGKDVFYLYEDGGGWFLWITDPADTPEEYKDGEVRSVSSSGGEKGVKPQRYSLLPPLAVGLIAEHFAKGAAKYADHNWRRGYEWSKSYDALQRHLAAFWSGEDYDEEMGSHHLQAAGFHVLALLTYTHDGKYGKFDDRYKGGDA